MGPGTAPPLPNDWQPSFQNFLPANGQPATGVTQAMMAMTPQGGMPPQAPPASGAQPQGAGGPPAASQFQLSMPSSDQLPGQGMFHDQAQQAVDTANKGNSIDAYMRGRDQLASILAASMQYMHPTGSGFGGGGGGGGYTTSGR